MLWGTEGTLKAQKLRKTGGDHVLSSSPCSEDSKEWSNISVGWFRVNWQLFLEDKIKHIKSDKCWNILESEKVQILRMDIYSYFLTKRSIFEEWTILIFHIQIRKDLDETNFISKIQVDSARKIFQLLNIVNFSIKFLVFYVSPCSLKTANNWV